jgi:hypothetical protein
MLVPFKKHHFGWKGVIIPFTRQANFELKNHLDTHVASKIGKVASK